MKIRIATPSLTGQVTTGFAHSMAETMVMLNMAEIEVQWKILSGCNFLHFARDKMAREFMASDATDLLFIDDDMEWNALDILTMLRDWNEEVIGGICPRAENAWNTRLTGYEKNGLFECDYIGTGIMRIARSAFERLGNIRYFDTEYIDDKMVGEDAWFCNNIRQRGGNIWAMPITVTHRSITLNRIDVFNTVISEHRHAGCCGL